MHSESTACVPDHPRMPENYIVDVSTICNLRCPDCPTGARSVGLTNGMMSLESFQAFFAMAKGYVKNICFINWGEAFLNKDFLDIVNICSSNGVYTETDTNLSFRELSDEDATRIIASGISTIRPSIDGLTQKVYESYRVGGNCKRVLENLRKLIVANRRLGSPCTIYFKFLVSGFSEHQVPDALAFAEELGIVVRFALLRSSREGTWSSYHRDPQKMIEANARFYTFYEEQGLGQHGVFQTKMWKESPLHKSLGIVCHQPFDVMVVNWNGDVMPCCAVYGDKFSLGNVFESGIEQVWNGEAYEKCRTFLKNYGPKQNTCSVCEVVCGVLKAKFLPAAE